VAALRSCPLAVLVVFCLTAAPAGAYSEHSVGTPEQIAWVRRAAGNFVSAELAGNGAGACAILVAPLRASHHHETCAQRWQAKLAAMLRRHDERGRLRRQLSATASARVVVHGNTASIDLPAPLIDSANRFVWTENCWMLTR
jgi:hypothetical protein